jgi:diketogulonate reductase-like aldo/keto reductase
MAQIAQRHRRTAAQVVLRFALEVGMAPLTGTTDDGQMQAEFEVFYVRLGPEDVERVEGVAVS